MGAIFLPTMMNISMWFVAWLTNGRITLQLPLIDYICLGIVNGFLCILGDLAVSFLKRCANKKDSGVAFSDHGGVLDRLDSALLVMPFMYWYAINFCGEFHRKNYSFDDVNLLSFLHF